MLVAVCGWDVFASIKLSKSIGFLSTIVTSGAPLVVPSSEPEPFFCLHSY